MAKKSVVLRNEARRALAAKFIGIRSDLRKQAVNMKLTDEERNAAQIKLQKLPRNTSKIRVRNRCQMTGRPRGNISKFLLSRLSFRQLAHKGLIPGMVKSSW